MDMDPNTALEEVRALVAKVIGARDVSGDVDLNGLADDLAEKVNGLDEWLSKGGFPPKDWLDKQGNPLGILEAIHRFYNSAGSLQRTEGRANDAAAYFRQAKTIKYAIDVLMGKEPVPEFRL
jgi:hypothetical protein